MRHNSIYFAHLSVGLSITTSHYNQACLSDTQSLETYLTSLFRGAAHKDPGITINDVIVHASDTDIAQQEQDFLTLFRILNSAQQGLLMRQLKRFAGLVQEAQS